MSPKESNHCRRMRARICSVAFRAIYVSVGPADDREQAVRLMQKHDLLALPVVDPGGVLTGVVAIDDVMDVAEEEATEDIQRQAGIEPLRTAYPEASVRPLFQKRLPWLAALVFVYLGASGVIPRWPAVRSSRRSRT